MKQMALADALLANLATFYLAMIFIIKAYGLITGRNFGAGVLVIASMTVVVVVLVLTLAWDVSRRAAGGITRYNRRGGETLNERHHNESGRGSCKGGICWHGLAVRSQASKVHFRLPQHIPY
ncbi:unnamed protein product [Thlaspi arvense]|uniref:Uncharacterized protein n=1 Tax=Thlaspi arvense TaxID=13288 RepID=A0AAU9REX2_THLAR|nr:unnamed protein product [Thlaspi arvense]